MTTVSLSNKGLFGHSGSNLHILTGEEGLSCSSTSMMYELNTSNSDIRIHGAGLSWE